MLDALHMDTLMSDVDSWRRDPESFLRQRGLNVENPTSSGDTEVFVLIVEGFLIFNHRYTRKVSVTSLCYDFSRSNLKGLIPF